MLIESFLLQVTIPSRLSFVTSFILLNCSQQTERQLRERVQESMELQAKFESDAAIAAEKYVLLSP